VPRLAVATRCATYCLQTHPIGDLPVIKNANTKDGLAKSRGFLSLGVELISFYR
jgi:hypothetical protein